MQRIDFKKIHTDCEKNLPQELKVQKRFCEVSIWYDSETKKWNKRPFVSWSDENNLQTFDDLFQRTPLNKPVFFGYVIKKFDEILVLDFDKVMKNGRSIYEFVDMFDFILRQQQTYIEFSVSGTGLHVFLKGSFPSYVEHKPQLYGCDNNAASFGVEFFGKRKNSIVSLTGNIHCCAIDQIISAENGGQKIIDAAVGWALGYQKIDDNTVQFCEYIKNL